MIKANSKVFLKAENLEGDENLRITKDILRITKDILRITKGFLRMTKDNLRITKGFLRMTRDNLRFASSLHLFGLFSSYFYCLAHLLKLILYAQLSSEINN